MTSERHSPPAITLKLLPWLAPLLVAGFVIVTGGTLTASALGALIGLVVVVLASRRPERALLALIVGLPLQSLILAQLYAWGLPGSFVRAAGSWKEALALGVVIAGIRGFRANNRRFDRLDRFGLAYVAIVTAYALAPHLFAPSAPTGTDVRLLAVRASAGFVLLLLGARHAELPADFPTRAARIAMGVGAAIAAISIYEFFFSSSWNNFIIQTVHYTRYQRDILNVTPFNPADIRYYSHLGGHQYVRVGSVLLSPLVLGFYLLAPFAVAIERTVRTGLRAATATVLVLIGGSLILTQTRAALVGAVAIAFLALRPAAGRAPNRRVQFGFVLLAGTLIALPVAVGSGLAERATTTASGDEKSATDHVQALRTSLDVVSAHPLGRGLGTSAGVGQRFQVQNTTISENYYLQVGIETGVLAMAVFVGLTLALLRRLRALAVAVPDLGIAAIANAAVGLAIGALFLHTWNDFALSWTLWGLAGAVLSVAAAAAPGPGSPGDPPRGDRHLDRSPRRLR